MNAPTGHTCAVHMLTAKILWDHTVAYVKKDTLGMDSRVQVSCFLKKTLGVFGAMLMCLLGCKGATKVHLTRI